MRKKGIAMLGILYGIAAVLTFLQLILLFARGGKNQSVYLVLLFVVTVICNIGYFAIAVSETAETALLCYKIVYLGAVFLPFFVLKTIAEICNTQFPKWATYLLLSYSFIVMFLVFSTGYSSIYYEDVWIEKIYGVTCLRKTYGPAHNAYKILLFGDVAISLAIVLRTVFYKKHFSKKTVRKILIALLVPCIIYVAERILDIQIELLPFAYIFVLLLFSKIQRKLKMYDLEASVTGASKRMEEYGYITFDLHKNFMNCNAMAKKLFPELKEAQIDKNIEPSDSVFYKEIVQWMGAEDIETEPKKTLQSGDYYIDCNIRKIYSGIRKKVIGYSIELIDDTKQEKYIRIINNYNSQLEQEVEEKTNHIKAIQESIVTGMASMVESRDNSTGGHIRRTSECVKIFAEALKADETRTFSDEFYENVVKAAPMHDLGKIAVDDVILRKPGKFTAEEYEQMKKHSEKGAEIVAEVLREVTDKHFKKIAVNVANYHHEKWDGTGYPEGLRETQIPVEARIMALADVFDALVSKRCYKEAYDYDTAFRIIEESLGSHFDPELGRIFMSCRPQLEALYNQTA